MVWWIEYIKWSCIALALGSRVAASEQLGEPAKRWQVGTWRGATI